MKSPLVHALLIVILLAVIVEPVHADPGSSRFVPGEVLVKFQPGLSPKAVNALAAGHRVQAVESIPRLGIWRLRVEPGREQAMARAWSALPQVMYAEPNFRVWATADPPNDTHYDRQWNLDRVQAPEAWEITRGDPSMPIAIIDTGIDLSHPDLLGKLWVNPEEIPGNGMDDDGNGYVDDVHGYDFVNDDSEPADDYGMGHGTHVAGIAAAATDNGLGVAGMAPTNPLMALKVLNSSGDGSYFDVARAIDYAYAQGARVMNLSLAGPEDSLVLHEAVQTATTAGALIVAAAGNDPGDNPPFYPAAYDEVLAVGATTSNDEIADLSAHHPYVGVAAPGINIYSTYRGGGYGYMSGTSMATPHASGLAALLWAAAPTLAREEVVGQITQSAEDLGAPGKDDYYGWGRINAHAALRAPVVAPSLLTFMADAHSLSVPASRTVQITNSASIPITWTATVSPASASWTLLTPVSGTLEPGGFQFLQVEVNPVELGEAYGDYTSRVEFASTCGTEGGAVDIHLHYVPRIHQLIFPLIHKS